MTTLETLLGAGMVGPAVIVHKTQINASAFPSGGEIYGVGDVEVGDTILDIILTFSPSWDGDFGQAYNFGRDPVTVSDLLLDGSYVYAVQGHSQDSWWSGASQYYGGGLAKNVIYSYGTTSLPALVSVAHTLSIHNAGASTPSAGYMTVYVPVIPAGITVDYPDVT